MSRTDARECGFKMIYESFFNNEIDVERFFDETIIDDEFSPKTTPNPQKNTDEDIDEGFLIDNDEAAEKYLTEDEEEFAKSIFKAYEDSKTDIEKKFQDNLKKGLKVSDIYMLDKAIIYAALVQIDKLQEPAGLVINEAVRMAKKYSTDNSPKFINGVLASIYRE